MRCFLTIAMACALLGSLAGCGFGTDDTLTTADLSAAAGQTTGENPAFAPLPDPDTGLTAAQIAAFKPDRMSEREFAFAYDCLLKTNAYRADQNPPLPALAWNKDVAAVAFGHAQDLLTTGRFTHDSVGPNFVPCQNLPTPNGGVCIPMRLQAGFPTPVNPIGRATENLADQSGPFSADQALTLWIGSAGHKLNLDDLDVTQLGVGYIESPTRFIYAQVFYRP